MIRFFKHSLSSLYCAVKLLRWLFSGCVVSRHFTAITVRLSHLAWRKGSGKANILSQILNGAMYRVKVNKCSLSLLRILLALDQIWDNKDKWEKFTIYVEKYNWQLLTINSSSRRWVYVRRERIKWYNCFII